MQFWDNIIHTAMMGTDKKQISTQDIPAGLEEVALLINDNPTKDKEEKFLQLAALTLNYRQCGVLPAKKELPVTPAPAEEKAYCNDYALQALNDIITEESIPLLKIWLQYCYEKQLIVPAEIVPKLLSLGVENKKLQLWIAACCGKRGEWLGTLNPAWNFSSTQTGEELWQTGSHEQRKEILRQTRSSDPAKAREWVQQTWAQEDAATKTDFLEILTDNTSEEDISFLQSLSTEKSKKVKEAALQLLKQIPGSEIVRQYEEVLRKAVFLKKEKALLGMMSKTTLQCKLPVDMDESVYKTGIDKLSNKKEMTDDEYVISQLMQSVPPSFWERQLELSPEKIIELLQKDTSGNKLIPALVNAITGFRDQRWALEMIKHSQVFYIDIIPLLEAQQQETYSNKYFDKFPDLIIQYSLKRDTEWSIELTKNIFKHMAKNIYQYNRSFYNQQVGHFPVGIISELERCTPSEEHFRSGWSTTSEYITKLISLKIQTIKAFK